MKKITLTTIIVAALLCVFCISAAAAVAVPEKPDLGVDFGTVTTIPGFEAPSSLYTSTDERVLLVDEDGNYATYPTYYVTKNSTTFDFDFSKLNSAQSIQYSKKSVVMVEIPNGVTTISGSYFSGTGNFPACVSVQFPGSVTSYGSSMFSTNTVIRAVEFLDGTEPITMGDSMFGSNWSVGTTNLEYVKFPNNLVSIGNSTFGKSHANKTIIFGENLEKIGTGFFGESTPNGKDTFIYCSANFFLDGSTMFGKLFGGVDKYHNSYMRITLFYTGTEAQAQAFIENGKAAGSGYIFDDNKAVLVSASEYDYATHKPTQEGDLTMVWGVNKCDAFYNGVHNEQALNGCQFGCANGCGAVALLENPVHSYVKTVLYGEGTVIDYYKTITICETCENCKTANDNVISIDPLFVNKGYSVDLTDIGIVQGFKVNVEAIEAYKQNVNADFEYGLVASLDYEAPLSVTDGKVVASESTVVAKMPDETFKFIEIKIVGIKDEYQNSQLVCCAYAYENGTIYYVGESTTTSAVYKSYNDLLPKAE